MLTVSHQWRGSSNLGAGADILRSRYAIHRSYLISLVSVLLMASQIVGALIEDANHLWIASLLLGLGYGGVFGLLPTVNSVAVH
jgi:cyanate permease